MPSAKASRRGRGAVAGPVSAVAEFSQANGDPGYRSEDLLDCITSVGAGNGRRGMQTKGLLRFPDQRRQVCLVVDRQPAFLQDDFGSALDEFLRAAYGEGGVIEDGVLNAPELLANG